MRKFLTAWLLLSALTLTARADPGVKDDGQLFKPETVEKANAELKQIHTDYGKELVVETFSTVPEAWKDEWTAAKDDPQKRTEFFGKWIGERAHQLQVNGVYVLICKDPGHLEVKAGQKTKVKAFTQANQNKLRDTLLESLKEKNDDEGLLKGVAYFREALKENMGGPHPVAPATPGEKADEQFRHPNSGTSSGSPLPNRTQTTNYPTTPAASKTSWSPIMSIILIVIVAFVIIKILAGLSGGSRNNSGGGGAGYGPGQGGGPGYGAGYSGGGGYGGGGGGGGFFRNMFGGLLGGAAGGYLYDKYRDSNNPSHNPQNPGGNFNPNTPDTSSGGDFNSPSSSSDDNDRGQGFGGGGSGADFGSSGSDAGSGFSSSDSGGSSGGDFGSSDSGSSGGGGDSGGGSSGDF